MKRALLFLWAVVCVGAVVNESRADIVYFSNQNADSISQVGPSGSVSQFAYTDAFSDPPYYPYGVALDSTGNVYVALTADYGSYGYGAIREYSPSGTLISKILTSTTLLPFLVALDGNSNLYMIARNTQRYSFYELDEVGNTGAVTVLYQFSTFDNPTALLIDPAGNIYIADTAILKFDTNHVMSTFAALPLSTWGIAMDSQGDIFATQNYTNGADIRNTVVKISPNGTVSPYASNFDNPNGLAITPAGNLYLAENDSSPSLGKIVEILPGGQVVTSATALFHPEYLVVQSPVTAPATDTPTLPPWAIVAMMILLCCVGAPPMKAEVKRLG